MACKESDDSSRFSSVTEEDLDKILLESRAESTTKSTKTWVAVFLDYLESKKIDLDLKTCSATELAPAP